jgi:hypothetical protein
MASEAGHFDPARAVALDQDPELEALYFLMKQTWSGARVEWDAGRVGGAGQR